VLLGGGGASNLSKTPYLSLIQGIIRPERLFLPMRRLCLILLCGLVAAPAALAGGRAIGDGVLELRAVDGTVVIAGKGVVWGQMDDGKLVVNDLDPAAGDILVSGWEHKRPGLCDLCTVYTGKDLHFRVTGGKYRLAFIDSAGVDFTAVGVGNAQLTGDPDLLDVGDYAIDGGKWTSVPWLKRTVYFGIQPAPVPAPAPAGP
jgi:hypothetical protein